MQEKLHVAPMTILRPQIKILSCIVALLGGTPAAAPFHEQVNQRQAPVEVITPKPPAPVMTGGRRVLVYELHVTNFGAQSLALQSVDVFGSLDASPPLATLRDSSLRAAFSKPGAMQ